MDFDDLNAAKHSLYGGPNMAGGEMVPFSEGQVPSLWKIPPVVVSLGARNLSAMVVSGLFGAVQGYKDSMPALKLGSFSLDLDLAVGLGLMGLEVYMLWTGKRTQYLAAHALDGASLGALCSYSNALGMMSGAKQKKRKVLTVHGDERAPVFAPPRPNVMHQPPVPRPQPQTQAAPVAPSFDPRFPFMH